MLILQPLAKWRTANGYPHVYLACLLRMPKLTKVVSNWMNPSESRKTLLSDLSELSNNPRARLQIRLNRFEKIMDSKNNSVLIIFRNLYRVPPDEPKWAWIAPDNFRKAPDNSR